MQIDIPTLYALTIGTLCVAVATTLWERRVHPKHSGELLLWSLAYTVFAAGCVMMMTRTAMPGIWGWTASNILMLFGYSLMLWGAARFDRRRLPLWPLPLIGATAVAWSAFGEAYLGIFWNHLSAIPIAAISGATGWMLLRSPRAAGLRSRRLAAALPIAHGSFYAMRAGILPALDVLYGPQWLHTAAAATMFEAVIYSVAMPMSLISLTREDTQRDLVTLSRTDHLTQLGNRQAFFENADRVAGDRPTALLAFDLDHFKAINDRYGHAVGDEVLKVFAHVLKTEAGPEACLARLGGEEFAALLPGLDAEAAGRIAERIGRRFSAETARRDGLAIRASVSVGVAETGGDVSGLSALLLTADRALYRAKRLGRDRVETGLGDETAAIRRRMPA